MIKDGLNIKVDFVKKFICLGTPEDYFEYNYWAEYFLSNNHKLIEKENSTINLIPLGGRESDFKKRVIKYLNHL